MFNVSFAIAFLSIIPLLMACRKCHTYLKTHDIISMLSYRYLATGGGVQMEVVITFLVTVAAGVVCHLISKWLDRHDKDNK